MLGTTIYLNNRKLDLFKDESIELNSSVQNINDISKTFTDYSQNFTVPASDNNNAIFQHYYNTDVDGTFNANIRQAGYIELGSLPFRYGTISLEEVKLKGLMPYAYSIRFYGAVVNLSDLFRDDELSILDLSDYNHEYNSSILDAVYGDVINSGDIYYPLITSLRNYEVGTGTANDISNVLGQIKYSELKPALKISKIIDAIELIYGINFDRSFINRAVFDNIYMWLHNKSETLTISDIGQIIDLTNATGFSGIDVDFNTTTNYMELQNGTPPPVSGKIKVKITPAVGFTTILYSVKIIDDNNNILAALENVSGTNELELVKTLVKVRFEIYSNSTFTFTPRISVNRKYILGGFISVTNAQNQASQTINGQISISANLPQMKVSEFIKSIIKMFNLVLVPTNSNTFLFLPLDDWYNAGKLINLTKYVDIKDVTIKKPKLFKRIEFKHQQSEQILNERFRLNNGLNLGYGDLRADYDIDGTELKIETGFENLMFERLQDRSTDDLTNIQVGKSIDKNLDPYIGKPFIFYKNGFTFYDTPIKCDAHADITYSFQTATENDITLSQVSNSINFSADISTYSYSEVLRNLFNNYWSDYISDLYSLKRRITTLSGYLPTGVLIRMKLNDRLKIGDKAYIINSFKSNLSTGKVDFELLNYIGQPFTSINDIVYLTADTIDYSADTELLTADMISLYVPQYSPYANGVEFTNLLVTPAKQNFDCKLTANQVYSVTKIDTGDGITWLDLENDSGIATGYLKILVSQYTAAITNDTLSRSMDLSVLIGIDTFTITITQGQL
jgi:hypothetical protein